MRFELEVSGGFAGVTRRFEVDTDPMRYPIDMAWKTGHAISPLALEFMDFIRENIPEGYFQSGE